jgi:hypothetical protein
MLPAGTIAADGNQHDLVAQIAPPDRAAYPLRLLAIALTYNWPSYGTAAGPATISLTGLAESAAPSGPFGPPFASGSAVAAWQPAVSAPDQNYLIRLDKDTGAQVPSGLVSRLVGRAQLISFDPGNGPHLTPQTVQTYGLQNLVGLMTLTAPDPVQAVPAMATSAFLADNNVHVGSTLIAPIATGTVRLHIVEGVSRFPTVLGAGAIIVDQAALQDELVSQQSAPLPVTAWWLRTAGGGVPQGLPAGSAVTAAASLAQGIRADPLLAAPVQAAVAISAAAALLAAFGFCVSVAASARARRSQRALLGALGLTPAAQARLFCLEELLLSVPAAAVGLAVGLGLAHLLVPALTLTANAGVPVPSVLVKIPIWWVVTLALAVPAIPVLAAAVSALRQPDPAAELRAAEAA